MDPQRVGAPLGALPAWMALPLILTACRGYLPSTVEDSAVPTEIAATEETGAPDDSPGETGPFAPGLVATVEASPEPPQALVVLATLQDSTVDVGGTVVVDWTVDVDDDDEDHPFRYRLVDGDGQTLHTDSDPGPVQVHEYLSFYSDIGGFDILDLFPMMGNFPVVLPLVEGAEDVVFELRTGDGEWFEAGTWDLARADIEHVGPSEAVVGHETLFGSEVQGSVLDIAIVGDGYTAGELDQYALDAAAAAAAILEAEPLATYADRIAIHRVDTVSAESGVSYDCIGECRLRDTAFESIFALEFVNLILGSDYRTAPVFQLDQWEVARAASVVPFDAVLVIANTEHTGGFALHYATVPTGSGTWTGTAVHELAHVLGRLGDEYVADLCVPRTALGLPLNITDNMVGPPWEHWIEDTTPVPTPDTSDYDGVIGTFAGAMNCEDLYRPARTCKMESSSEADFCQVCAEQLVRRTLGGFDIIDTVEVEETGGLRARVTTTVDATITWTLDGQGVGTTGPGEWIALDPTGPGRVEARATLASPWLRTDYAAVSEVRSIEITEAR